MPTVREDVAFGLRRRGLSKDQVAARVAGMLATYGLEGHADHPAHLLSGGQKLLALSSVLAEPAVLVMDEPTTLLDLRNAAKASGAAGPAAAGRAGDAPPGPARRLRPGAGLRRHPVVYDGTPASAVAHYRELMA